MPIKNHRFLLCLTGTLLLTAGVIFLPRHFSRSLDLRNLNQVEVSAREDFSFLEQGANDVLSAVHAFQFLNHDSGNPVLLASIEEPIQINGDLVNEVYIEAMTASEYSMLPWLRHSDTDASVSVYDAGTGSVKEAVWLNWSDYIRSAQYYSLSCTSEENPKKQELLNFWYLRFSDMQTFDYYFVVNAVNYQIYYAEIHNEITDVMIRESEEYSKAYAWNESDGFYPFYGEGFAGGCMAYYQASGCDVINQDNLYQKLNLAILYFESGVPVYIERSVSEREDTVEYRGICIGFQELIRWVRQLPKA